MTENEKLELERQAALEQIEALAEMDPRDLGYDDYEEGLAVVEQQIAELEERIAEIEKVLG